MATYTFQTLAGALNGLALQIPGIADAHMKTVVREVAIRELPNTPVDTGRARANWQVVPSASVPPTEIPVPPQTAAHIGKRKAGAPRADKRPWYISYSAAMSKLRAQVAVLPRGIPFVSLYNNVPYLEQLNAGSSQQALPSFIQSALYAGIRSAEAKLHIP